MFLGRSVVVSLLLQHCTAMSGSDCGDTACYGFGSVEFNVVGPLEEFEQVFIVGNTSVLGQWKPEQAVRLDRKPSYAGDTWTVRLSLPKDCPIEYRLFTAFSDDEALDRGTKTRIAIVRWEAFEIPRQLLIPPNQSSTNVKCVFGSKDGMSLLKDGWLTEQYEVRLMINGRSVRFLKQPLHSVRVKASTSVLDMSANSSAATAHADQPSLPCYLSVLTSEDSAFKQASDNVVLFGREDVLVVKKQCFTGLDLVFRIEFFPPVSAAASPSAQHLDAEPLGSTVVLTSALRNNFGYSILPVLDRNGMVVGEIGVQYLVVHPTRHTRPDFPARVDRPSYNAPLNVGHRGMGNSYTKYAVKRENTISSFRKAASCGADFVEFDVQLTKDSIPIVFHDFDVRLWAERRWKGARSPSVDPSSDLEMHTVRLSTLKLENLRSLKIEHAKAKSNLSRGYSTVCSDDEATEEDLAFPTLEQVFKALPGTLGFNVEIKYPQVTETKQNSEGERDVAERNVYIDQILETVFQHAGSRDIIFSSFDPETCLMLKLKQNKYPVMFLTQGNSKRYERYADVRMQCSKIAVHFAHSNGLQGVAFHSEDILRDVSPLRLSRSLQLMSFVWGDDLDSAERVDHFRALGFDGIIYDQMDRFKSATPSC